MRSLLIVMTLFCLAFAWLYSLMHRAEEQRKAVAWVSKHQGWVKYDWQFGKGSGPSGRKWLRERLGDDLFQTVEQVSLYGEDIDVSVHSPVTV